MEPQDLLNAPDMLTVSDLQKLLNIGRSTAYRLIENGEIRCIRVGRTIRIPKRFVADFIKNSIFIIENNEKICYNKNVTADDKSQSGELGGNR